MNTNQDWKPIESAPKDGSEFLACYGRQGNVLQLVKWNKIHGYFESKGKPELGLTSNATDWMPVSAPTSHPIPTGATGEDGRSATYGMTLGERIAHVGGRTNAQSYTEFGSPMAVNALIQHVLRDLDWTRQDDDGAYQARYRLPGGEWSSWGHVVCGVKGHEQELRYLPGERRPAPAAGDALDAAARDVLAERQRQISAEGWTLEHDDAYADGQMAVAAGYFALASGFPHERDIGHGHLPVHWPWAATWWKPRTPRENLVRAGALIVAEIERLDRVANVQQHLEKGTQ